MEIRFDGLGNNVEGSDSNVEGSVNNAEDSDNNVEGLKLAIASVPQVNSLAADSLAEDLRELNDFLKIE